MKKIIIALVITLTACTDFINPNSGSESWFHVDKTEVVLEESGLYTASFELFCNYEWEFASMPDWILIESISAVGPFSNHWKITVSVKDNSVDLDREGVIIITSNPDKASVSVIQKRKGNNGSHTDSSSSLSKGDGTVENPFSVAGAIEHIKQYGPISSTNMEDYYVKGTIAAIKEEYGSVYGNATFDITDDGSIDSETFKCYRILYYNDRKWQIGDSQIKVGDEVVVCGLLTSYEGIWETAQNMACLYSLNGEKETTTKYESDISSKETYSFFENRTVCKQVSFCRVWQESYDMQDTAYYFYSTNTDVVATPSQPSYSDYSGIFLDRLEIRLPGEAFLICKSGDGSKEKCFTRIIVKPLSELPEGAIDLGLRSMWANCNLGALKPTETGDFFAWGETRPKTFFDFNNYSLGKEENGLKQYFYYTYLDSDAVSGTADNEFCFEDYSYIHDAAYMSATPTNKWIIPDRNDWNELISLDREWITIDGTSGYRFTAKNGNSIFIPAAGYKVGDNVYSKGEIGYYWMPELSTVFTNSCSYAYSKILSSERFEYATNSTNRYFGCTIRPVVKLD